MTRFALIRHGITAWNRERRIQGWRDEPLSAEGRDALRGRRLPEALSGWAVLASPLGRAVETAALLTGSAVGAVATDARLKEMNWGQWEGERLDDLRRRFGGAMQANEARGLEFRPPGGECPREVQARARACLAEAARTGRPHVIVTHKGVIRVLLAAGWGWDMTDRAPVKLDWTAAHMIDVDDGGAVTVCQANLALEAR